ncbi:hypothetical protein MMIN_30230 [Mycolicibacter minnesotensis]|nr:hypothetical protein MMIN_30230 [Mycolicibacter minnesotensis]
MDRFDDVAVAAGGAPLGETCAVDADSDPGMLGEGAGAQPPARAAAALTTDRTATSLRMVASVEALRAARPGPVVRRDVYQRLVYVACGGYQGPVRQR